jgi:hypothetical protein
MNNCHWDNVCLYMELMNWTVHSIGAIKLLKSHSVNAINFPSFQIAISSLEISKDELCRESERNVVRLEEKIRDDAIRSIAISKWDKERYKVLISVCNFKTASPSSLFDRQLSRRIVTLIFLKASPQRKTYYIVETFSKDLWSNFHQGTLKLSSGHFSKVSKDLYCLCLFKTVLLHESHLESSIHNWFL